MTWFKVDDKFHSHPKVARLGDDIGALALWVIAGSWSSDQLTDGWVPSYVMPRLDPDVDASTRRCAALVRVGLWEEDERDGVKGWVFHDWNDEGRQPTADKVKKDRAFKTARQKRWRDKKSGRYVDDVDGDVDASSNASVDAAHVDAAPTRPDPTRPKVVKTPSESSSSGLDKPGARADVDRLCGHLADRVEQNYGKRPTVGKCWRQAARLLLDSDGHTEDQIIRAIDWATDDEFWRPNVRSMSKLREKYIQLREAARRAQAKQNGHGPRVATSVEKIDMVDRAADEAKELLLKGGSMSALLKGNDRAI